MYKATVYFKLDASSAFHQIPLDRESCQLTTSITQFGKVLFSASTFWNHLGSWDIPATDIRNSYGHRWIWCYNGRTFCVRTILRGTWQASRLCVGPNSGGLVEIQQIQVWVQKARYWIFWTLNRFKWDQPLPGMRKGDMRYGFPVKHNRTENIHGYG